MAYLIKLAARNLRRNRFRTAISVLAIAVVVMIVVFGRGLMQGFTESSFGLYIDNELGHVRLVDEEYRRRETLLSLDYPVNGAGGHTLERMVSRLKASENILHVLPRLRFGASAGIDDNLIRMAGVGIDIQAEFEYGAIGGDLTEGRMPEADDEILVGSGLLEKLKAEKGGRVTIIFSDAFQSLRGRTFTIAGIRKTGSPAVDNNFFFLPLEAAQKMLAMEGEATELLIFGKSSDAAGRLEAEVSEYIADWGEEERYSSVAWHRADPFIELFIKSNEAMKIIYVFFILLGAVVVISTMFMIVQERKTEIGMMSALGLKGKEIMAIFMLEGAMKGILGSFLGAAGGGALNYHFSREGLYVESLARVVEGSETMMDPVLRFAFSFENLVFSFVLGAVITTLGCLYPAHAAARQNPVEALRKDV